jgi:hypothetical protein
MLYRESGFGESVVMVKGFVLFAATVYVKFFCSINLFFFVCHGSMSIVFCIVRLFHVFLVVQQSYSVIGHLTVEV